MDAMRGRWGLWVAMAVLGATSLSWYAGLFAGLRPYVVALANHPGVAEAFSDPLSARTDALLMLVSVFLLTPVLLGVVLGVIVFAVIVALLVSEPVLRPLNLPSWICVPLVLAGV